jgi:hypothetical protein
MHPLARTIQKTAIIVKQACLLDVLLLHAYASWECVYRAVA